MMGKDIQTLTEHPFCTVGEFAKAYPGTLVWKDACTVIRCAQGEVYLNKNGNDGMATAGSGDVLAGLLGGFLASGLDPSRAAPLGVYLHGAAGDIARERKGRHAMTARDILDSISTAVSGGAL